MAQKDGGGKNRVYFRPRINILRMRDAHTRVHRVAVTVTPAEKSILSPAKLELASSHGRTECIRMTRVQDILIQRILSQSKNA